LVVHQPPRGLARLKTAPLIGDGSVAKGQIPARHKTHFLERSHIMFPRILATAVAVLAFAVCQSALAADETHEGTVVKAGSGELTMTMKGDEKRHTHEVAKDAVVKLDGKAAKLDELKAGFHVTVTIDAKHVVTKIEAHSKK
jgi:hypothetical protein